MPVPSQSHYGFHSFRLLTDFVCLYNYEFWLSLCKIVRSSVILLLPLFTHIDPRLISGEYESMIIIFTRVKKHKHFLLCFFYLFILTLIHRTFVGAAVVVIVW